MLGLRIVQGWSRPFVLSLRRRVATIWFLACEPWLWLVAATCGFLVVASAPLDAWGRVLVDGCVLAVAAAAAARRLPSRAHQLQRELESRLRAANLDPRRLRPQTFAEAVNDRSSQSVRYWRDVYLRAREDPGGIAKSIVACGFSSFVVALQARIVAHMLYVDKDPSAVLVFSDAVVAILDVLAIGYIFAGRLPLPFQARTAAPSYPSRRSPNQPITLLSIPLALLAALIALLWLTFWYSHGSAEWRSAAFLGSFLGVSWSSRKALVRPFSALERITSRLWPAYAAAYHWLWSVIRCGKACLTATVIIALPVTVELSIDTPPATMHAAQALSNLLVVLWGLQLTFGLILRAWRQPSTVKLVTAAQAHTGLADGPAAERITLMLWGLFCVLAIWLVAGA
jgi:hypothetical protein